MFGESGAGRLPIAKTLLFRRRQAKLEAAELHFRQERESLARLTVLPRIASLPALGVLCQPESRVREAATPEPLLPQRNKCHSGLQNCLCSIFFPF